MVDVDDVSLPAVARRRRFSESLNVDRELEEDRPARVEMFVDVTVVDETCGDCGVESDSRILSNLRLRDSRAYVEVIFGVVHARLCVNKS